MSNIMMDIELPSGNDIFGDLNLNFIDFNSLLDDIAEKGIDGYIFLRSDGELEGIVVLIDGETITSKYIGEGLEVTEVDELIEEMESGTQINVYSTDIGLVKGLEAHLNGNPLHKNLETSYMDIGGFIEDMMDDELTGCMVAHGKDFCGCATFQSGDVVNAVVRDGDHQISEFPSVIDSMQNADAKVDVYEYEIDEDIFGEFVRKRRVTDSISENGKGHTELDL